MHEVKSPQARTAARSPAAGPVSSSEAKELREAIQALSSRVGALEDELGQLKANPPAGGCCTIA